MHACIHTYIQTHIHTYIHPSMHAYIHTYIHTHIYIHTYIHTNNPYRYTVRKFVHLAWRFFRTFNYIHNWTSDASLHHKVGSIQRKVRYCITSVMFASSQRSFLGRYAQMGGMRTELKSGSSFSFSANQTLRVLNPYSRGVGLAGFEVFAPTNGYGPTAQNSFSSHIIFPNTVGKGTAKFLHRCPGTP